MDEYVNRIGNALKVIEHHYNEGTIDYDTMKMFHNEIGEDFVTKLGDEYEVIIEDEPEKLRCEWSGTQKASEECTGKNLTSFYHHGETRLMTLCNHCREKVIIERFSKTGHQNIRSFDM